MNPHLARRDVLKGGIAFAALAFAQYPLSIFGFPKPPEGALTNRLRHDILRA
jgi:hypothetical protein